MGSDQTFLDLQAIGNTAHCNDAACESQVQWGDGSPFEYSSIAPVTINANGLGKCFIMNSGDFQIHDMDCTHFKRYLCQLDCMNSSKWRICYSQTLCS